MPILQIVAEDFINSQDRVHTVTATLPKPLTVHHLKLKQVTLYTGQPLFYHAPVLVNFPFLAKSTDVWTSVSSIPVFVPAILQPQEPIPGASVAMIAAGNSLSVPLTTCINNTETATQQWSGTLHLIHSADIPANFEYTLNTNENQNVRKIVWVFEYDV